MLLRRNNFPPWTILSPQPADNYSLRYVRDKARGSRILLWSRYVALILRQTLWFPLCLSCSPLVGCRSYRRLCLIIFTYCLRAVYCTVCTARDVTNVIFRRKRNALLVHYIARQQNTFGARPVSMLTFVCFSLRCLHWTDWFMGTCYYLTTTFNQIMWLDCINLLCRQWVCGQFSNTQVTLPNVYTQ